MHHSYFCGNAASYLIYIFIINDVIIYPSVILISLIFQQHVSDVQSGPPAGPEDHTGVLVPSAR